MSSNGPLPLPGWSGWDWLLRNLYRVGLSPCPTYEKAVVDNAVNLALERSGGGPEIGNDVLLKANLLAPVQPECAVTTHPAILSAIATWVRGKKPGVEVTISDSPGYLFSGQWPLFVENCGLEQRGEKEPIKVLPLNDEGFMEIEKPETVVLGKFSFPVKAANAGTLFNVAKCKTHVETEITGCLKNTFAYLDTATRKRAHRSGSLTRLCDAILDAHLARRPDWNILDAVIGMEGYGPSHGTPRKMGWIIASENALAADVVAAVMMGYGDPFKIPLLAVAARRGMGPSDKGQIELHGATWEELPVPGFRKAPSALRRLVPTPLRGLAHSLVKLNPFWSPDSCTLCKACVRVCPAEAIRIRNGLVEIDRRRCVRCLCCHEMCTAGAMKVRPNLLARLLLKK